MGTAIGHEVCQGLHSRPSPLSALDVVEVVIIEVVVTRHFVVVL